MEVLTMNEAANLLKVPKRTLQYLVSSQQVPFFRVGRRGVRFSVKRLEEWSREREGVELRYKPRKPGTDE